MFVSKLLAIVVFYNYFNHRIVIVTNADYDDACSVRDVLVRQQVCMLDWLKLLLYHNP